MQKKAYEWYQITKCKGELKMKECLQSYMYHKRVPIQLDENFTTRLLDPICILPSAPWNHALPPGHLICTCSYNQICERCSYHPSLFFDYWGTHWHFLWFVLVSWATFSVRDWIVSINKVIRLQSFIMTLLLLYTLFPPFDSKMLSLYVNMSYRNQQD